MEFLYTLKLIPRLQENDVWTAQDELIVSDYFNKLKQLKEKGKLILAGRTLRDDPSDFGIVILHTETEDEAQKLMEDPAVAHSMMIAELYPYRVALLKGSGL
ncbi:MAG: YciI family protein [Candidatus Celaenobacter polaris]|nr:YciI family protein [Candidatus Celaenobacter polaris]